MHQPKQDNFEDTALLLKLFDTFFLMKKNFFFQIFRSGLAQRHQPL